VFHLSKKLRLGIIGCGGIANGHVTRSDATGHAEIVALMEPNEDTFTAFVARHESLAKAKRYATHTELLAEAKLDGVIICSPHCFHHDQIMDSLAAGVNVLCEKPMCSTVDDALEVVQKAEETGLVCMIAYQRHFMAQFRWIRDTIKSGEFGKLNFVQALQSQQWLRAVAGTWRQKLELSCGGQLNDSGSHLVDIILWTTGMVPDEVFAFIDNLGSEVDILSAISMRSTENTLCNISIVGHAVQWWEDLTFWFDDGTIYMRNGQLSVHGKDGKPIEPDCLANDSNANANFIEAITKGVEPETPALCGLRVMELTESAWKAGESGVVTKVKHVL
jgi:predicted dehydrogenase